MSQAQFHNASEPGRLPTFSHAAVAGDTIYVSGTLGTLDETVNLARGGTAAETTQTLRNIEKILRSVGAELTDVVKVNVSLRDMGTFRCDECRVFVGVWCPCSGSNNRWGRRAGPRWSR